MEWVHFIEMMLLSFFFLALIYSAYTDLAKGKIYNWITYPAIFLGFIFRILSEGGPGFISSLFGAFLGFIFLFLFFIIGGIGAGDVKLMTAVGAFGGGLFLLWVLYYTAIVGGFVAVFILLVKGELGKGMKRTFYFLKNIFLPAEKKVSLNDSSQITVPFGAIIVVGTYLTYFLVGI